MPLPERWRWIRGAAALLFVAFATAVIVRQWTGVQQAAAQVEVDWPGVGLATVTVLAAYALLTETWRRTVAAWGERLGWSAAMRIWFVSNLGRYVPGKVWQIGAMGMLAQERGVSAVAATGSAVVVNIVSVIAGVAVVVATGGRVLARYAGEAIALSAVLVIALLFLPLGMTLATRLYKRITGSALSIGTLPPRALIVALVGTTAAWLLYGVAFRWFALAVGAPQGGVAAYTAAYTFSYLLGYLVLIAPGGIGVREGALVASMTQLGLASVGEATVVAVTSRLWLTALEVLPGVLLVAFGATRRKAQPSSE